MSEARAAGMELASARAQGSELVLEARETAKARLRMAVREELETDAARAAFAEADPRPALRTLCAAHMAPGAEGEFEEVIGELVDEARTLAKLPPSLYLVDHSTGKAVMPFRADMVYQPPDYVDEDGVTRPARPILHPGVAAPLTELVHESAASKRALLTAAGAGSEHMSDPQSIAAHAREVLESRGYKFVQGNAGPPVRVSVGRESLGEPRLTMHRSRMFGTVLASRIEGHMSGGRTFNIGDITPAKNSSYSWFEAEFSVG